MERRGGGEVERRCGGGEEEERRDCDCEEGEVECRGIWGTVSLGGEEEERREELCSNEININFMT